MTSQKKIKNLVSAYSAIRIDYGDFMDEILLDLKEHGFSSEALLRLGVIDIPGKAASLTAAGNEEFEKESVHWLFNEYTSLCQDAGDEPEDITDSLERLGFTCEEMAEYGFEGVEAEDDFPYEEDEAPAVVNVDMAASFMQPPVKRDNHPLRFEDYTLEECPNCESEVVIRATGISRCPRCGKPILPCTTCSSCTTPCPYGYTGRFNERLKPTNPPITQREVNFYMTELNKRKER